VELWQLDPPLLTAFVPLNPSRCFLWKFGGWFGPSIRIWTESVHWSRNASAEGEQRAGMGSFIHVDKRQGNGWIAKVREQSPTFNGNLKKSSVKFSLKGLFQHKVKSRVLTSLSYEVILLMLFQLCYEFNRRVSKPGIFEQSCESFEHKIWRNLFWIQVLEIFSPVGLNVINTFSMSRIKVFISESGERIGSEASHFSKRTKNLHFNQPHNLLLVFAIRRSLCNFILRTIVEVKITSDCP
jgi:hypothetical protein